MSIEYRRSTCQDESMTDVNPVLVEKYQLMLQSDPRAKVFAPLAEAYRKMGLVEEGIQICEKGVEFHPDFAGGRVALGRLYISKGDLTAAEKQLAKAVELSPENLLAQGLLGETYIKLRQPKLALKAYKMLLLLNPQDEKASSVVRKLESLTADEYDEDVFAMAKLPSLNEVELEKPSPLKPLSTDQNEARRARDLARYISLADAFMVRNEFERAEEALLSAEKIHGIDKEISRRLKLINQRNQDDEPETSAEPLESRQAGHVDRQIKALRDLKGRIESRKRKT